MIYALQIKNLLGHKAPIKIGFSATPEGCKKRFRDAQTYCPDGLDLILKTTGDRKLEKLIHSFLGLFHIRGEWYRGTEELCLPLWLKQFYVDSFKKAFCEYNYLPLAARNNIMRRQHRTTQLDVLFLCREPQFENRHYHIHTSRSSFCTYKKHTYNVKRRINKEFFREVDKYAHKLLVEIEHEQALSQVA